MQPREISGIWISETMSGKDLVVLQRDMEEDYGSEEDRVYCVRRQVLILSEVGLTS